MSTLPFLLSVADELDNIHTQSYMDDFGLGFHPHRQYYRTPTIQLSLPASTEWTSGRDWQGRHARYRSYKYYDESQSKLDEQLELELEQQQQQQAEQLQQEQLELEQQQLQQQQQQQQQPPQQLAAEKQLVKSTSHDVGVGGLGLNLKAAEEEDDENIDRTVRMYNLSKKCCKNYYRHALEMDAGNAVNKCSQLRSESQHSSFSSDDDESMPKLPSPIEFLTCFLIKKSSSSHRHAAAAKQS
ncbi:CG13685 [Drosophila busckii]|uniref:CG13685 n=1 Tax=Drosophila busckii TaxID=30019 RepID=A0A0M4EHY7_DROBS|nr:alpha-protein kinase 1 [Drosophila busckii]ALC43388.1 CG13685 [Drosophila busckii]